MVVFDAIDSLICRRNTILCYFMSQPAIINNHCCCYHQCEKKIVRMNGLNHSHSHYRKMNKKTVTHFCSYAVFHSMLNGRFFLICFYANVSYFIKSLNEFAFQYSSVSFFRILYHSQFSVGFLPDVMSEKKINSCKNRKIMRNNKCSVGTLVLPTLSVRIFFGR